MKKIVLDIFCGSGSVSTVARSLGYEVISVDIRRRKGVCEPTLCLDLLDLPDDFFCSLKPYIIWFGMPCDIFSNASGGFHLDKNYQALTDKAVLHLQVFRKMLAIIDKVQPTYFFIENPRGKLDKYPVFKKWLDLKKSVIYYCTLSSYGFSTTKPTMIATNYQALTLKPLDPFGRGAKNKVPGTFSNLTKVQRQKTPESLVRHIFSQLP